MKYHVSIACTVQAYARVEVEAASQEELKSKVAAILDEQSGTAGDASFEVEWGGAEDYRIVSVQDEAREDVLDFDEIDAVNDK